MGRLAFALIAVVLVGGVAGCTDDADGETPKPVPSTTATTSASPTPTGPTAPPLPDNAKGHTAKAAANFVEHYIELLNYASSTGDVAPLRKVSTKKCKGCNSYIKLYEKTYANGGYFKDSGWRLRSPVAETERDHMVVLADVTTPDTRFKLKAGDPPKKGKGGKFELRFESVYGQKGWRMTRLERQTDLGDRQ